MLNEVVGILIVIPIYVFYFLYLLTRKISITEHIIIFVFFAYLGVVISITLFPFPIQEEVILEMREFNYLSNNFIPLNGIIDMLRSETIYVIVRNVLGNIILTMPLGFLLPFISKKMDRFKLILISGFLFSLGIESVQFLLSSFLGFTYKITDVDDMILNVIGAVIGYICFRLLKFIVKP